MFTKSIAAIYFSGNKILVAELDSSRKKIKKSASIDLPQSVLSSNKIIDKKGVTEALKSLWTKFGIKSKDVGIIIPEFSTFTKLMSLPRLTTAEINEAVEFQAQEYLPTGVENMVLDWKILEKTDTSTETLMVAVPKDILMNYVDVCVSAGLFPIAVETPSVSLANIITSDGGFIALLVEDSQTLIVSGDKNKILVTNVTSDKTSNAIANSVAKIMKHFTKIKFSTLFIGGEAVSSDLADNLKNTFKVNVNLLDPKVDGEAQTIQKQLVLLALLKSPIAEPSDPKTLNLLPVNLVDRYQKQKARVQVWSLTLTVTVFVWVSLLVVLGSFMVLTQQIVGLKSLAQKNAQISAERQKVELQAGAINKISADVLKIKNVTIYPEVILNLIFTAKPVGVSIDSYDLDLDKGTIGLRGLSSDRQSLIAFKENLEKVPEFGSVNIPISSFEAVTNLSFTINFAYTMVDLKTSAVKVQQ